jgi:transposase
MGMPELIVTAVLVEGRSKSEVARAYGVSRRWVITLLQRYQAEGESGLAARSRRPLTSPRRTPPEVEGEIIRIRKQLDREGHEAGAATIAAHLERRAGRAPAVSTIWRLLTTRGFVTPQPHKRPKSSYLRFQAEQPNERWQLDITHWSLADGTTAEILNIINDHSRLCLDVHTRRTFKGPDVDRRFRNTAAEYGNPSRCCPTTGRCSPARPAAAAGSCSNSPCSPSASASTTPGRTTRSRQTGKTRTPPPTPGVAAPPRARSNS